MILYKFMSNPEYFLEEGYLRATQLSGLNDPFEAMYCEQSLVELTTYFENQLTSSELLPYIEEHKNKIGVICLTEAKDNLLMWSHYANEHKGVAIGFYVPPPHSGSTLFKKLHKLHINSNAFHDSPFFKGQCLPVMYRKQPRYRTDMFDFDYSAIAFEGQDQILHEIFQQKSDEWIYEKEHRITLRLEQADKVVIECAHRLESSTLYDELISLGELDKKGNFTIYLDKIEDSFQREIYASLLATLSSDPTSKYFFKMPHAISIIFGINSPMMNDQEYTQSFGCFNNIEVWGVRLNQDFYTLDFFELEGF